MFSPFTLFLIYLVSLVGANAAQITTPAPQNGCPTGYTLNAANNYCYKLYHNLQDGINFYDAEQSCQNDWPGGHLVWPTSQAENDFVKGLFSIINPSEEFLWSVWMGATRSCPGEAWHFTSMQNITYNHWSYTPSTTTTFACGAMLATGYSQPGKWDNDGCFWQKYGYICNAPKTGTTNPPPIIYQSGCDNFWCRHNSSCYRTYGSQMPWEDADNMCQRNGGHLISIHNSDQSNQALLMADQLTYVSGSQFWIGLSLLNSPNGQFQWTDHSPLDYSNWVPGEPNHSSYFDVESCGQVFSSQKWGHSSWIGKWNDDRCDENRPFICQKYAHGYTPPTYPPPPVILGNCPGGWSAFGNRCYKYHGQSQAANWTSAQQHCRGNRAIRANLVSVRNVYEQMFVQQLLNIEQSDIWIGLYVKYGSARWVDESVLRYTNWDFTFNTWSGNALMHGGSATGKWLQVNQTAADIIKLPFVCVQNKNPTLPTVTPTPNSCPSGSGFNSYQGDACYEFIPTPAKFMLAQSYCHGLVPGAHLASINDPYELAYITASANAQNIKNFWIGLNSQKTPQQFVWADGWPVFLTNWGPNQPDTNPNKQCVIVAMNSTTYGSGWYTDNCTHLHPALCKYSTAIPPTVSTKGSCPPGWVTGSSMCFLIQAEKPLPFTDSHFECEKNGTNLASFHSLAEINYLIRQAAIKTSPVMFYIGLYKTQAGFTWTDGSQADFFNWAQGQPSNVGDSRETVTAMDAQGLFHTVNSHTSLYSICEEPKSIAAPTSPLPSGTGIVPTNPTFGPNCNGTGYRVQIFLEFFDNSAGGGLLLARPPKTHCDRFWFTGIDQCDIALKLCVESTQGSSDPTVCSTGWIDLEQVSNNNNNATFLNTGQYGGWNNPMLFSMNGVWAGFQIKYLAEDVDTGGRQTIDNALCSFPASGSTISGVAGCKHIRPNGYNTYFQIGWRLLPLCGTSL